MVYDRRKAAACRGRGSGIVVLGRGGRERKGYLKFAQLNVYEINAA